MAIVWMKSPIAHLHNVTALWQVLKHVYTRQQEQQTTSKQSVNARLLAIEVLHICQRPRQSNRLRQLPNKPACHTTNSRI